MNWKKIDPLTVRTIQCPPMSNARFQIFTDKNLTPREITDLLIAVGWEPPLAEHDNVERILADRDAALERAHFIVHARDEHGRLVGIASVTRGFAQFVELLLVHPKMQRRGVGKTLLAAVGQHFQGNPFYITPFKDQQDYFIKQGFKIARRPMMVLFHPNGMKPFVPTPETQQLLAEIER
ncbi:MAG: GNAT family N-acetyltransferase [Verrucomicrobiales bacterium]|jgi:GNAT superfamily N-acetyltransferase|nr:GNAT family N-acetyltransferase [Verrucomicrobiales bacterium]